MSKLYLFVALAFSSACPHLVCAQTTAGSQGEPIAAIRAYEGTWKLKSDTLETPHSKAGHDEKEIRNDCWRSGGYYACNQYVDGDSKILLVFTFDAGKKIYTSYLVPADGRPASSGVLQIQGDTWIFPWENTEEGHVVYYRVVNVFKSPKLIEYRREFSTDKANWTGMDRGTEVKIK
jgi:hypothetical protein